MKSSENPQISTFCHKNDHVTSIKVQTIVFCKSIHCISCYYIQKLENPVVTSFKLSELSIICGIILAVKCRPFFLKWPPGCQESIDTSFDLLGPYIVTVSVETTNEHLHMEKRLVITSDTLGITL